jgi:dTDP-4-amino-4,6-dideoxygalactose transaminase
MDPHKLDETLRRLMSVSSTAKRVKAVLPVHTFGQMADMPNILEITSYYDLPVVEDAACALGASWQGRQAGSWGVMGCFSFHPRKAITTGDGGMVVTNDSSLARKLRILRNHGLDPDACAPEFVVPGFNYRMTEFQAALGLTQMSKLKRIVIARRKLAKHYDELLKGSLLKSPYTPEGSDPVYQSYVVLLPEYIAPHRAELIAELKRQGIEAGIGTWHMPLTSYYRSRYGYRLGDFPATDDVFARSLALPMFETLRPSEQEKVVRAMMNLISEMD